jgi:hypothetical protein
MADDSSASTPPELQVLLDMEMTVEGLESAGNHQKLQAALVDVPGVESVSFTKDKLAIQYHPQRVTKERLSELIRAAGFSITGSESAPPAPPIDAKS